MSQQPPQYPQYPLGAPPPQQYPPYSPGPPPRPPGGEAPRDSSAGLVPQIVRRKYRNVHDYNRDAATMTANGFTVFAQDRKETTWGRMIYPNTSPPIPPQAKASGKGPVRGGLSLVGGLLAIVVILSIVGSRETGYTTVNSNGAIATSALAGTLTNQGSLSAYKNVDVRDLTKDPESFKSQRIQLTGTVFNIHTSGNTAQLQMDVQSPSGSQPVMVNYVGATDGIYEKTKVTVYGVAEGVGGGKNAFGASLSQPLITAQRIEIV